MKKVFSIVALALTFAFVGCDEPDGDVRITSIQSDGNGTCTVGFSDGRSRTGEDCAMAHQAYATQQQRLQEVDQY